MEDFVNVLALSKEQHEWMLGLKAAKVYADAGAEKDEKKALAKTQWLTQWLDLEQTAFKEQFSTDVCALRQTPYELCQRSAELLAEDSGLTWYYLAVMEAELFIPYGPLYGEEEKEKNKPFKGLKFHSADFVKQFVMMDGRIPVSFIDRVNKTYKDAIARMDGRFAKIAIGTLSAVAISAVTAATAGTFAGPIAVAIAGSQFTFHGAALTSASLAALAGGSLAAGGAGSRRRGHHRWRRRSAGPCGRRDSLRHDHRPGDRVSQAGAEHGRKAGGHHPGSPLERPKGYCVRPTGAGQL